MKCNKDRPSSWIRYKEQLCSTCRGSCCTMPVEVQLNDLIRLKVVNAEEALTTAPTKKMVSHLIKNGIVKSYRKGTDLFMLKQKANDDCIFLDSISRRCTVYENRPDVCRNFPSIGPRPNWCPWIQK